MVNEEGVKKNITTTNGSDVHDGYNSLKIILYLINSLP
jgi:propanediol dehydratase large subunit